ncbi:MAG: hypothetical protein EAX96_08955 [Candidatus Lokiarchaeota archaeon]|nr:hypothetical protein [Candidatus Lokiarchaeota archaeon]
MLIVGDNIKGIMKKGVRVEENWKNFKYNEPYSKATKNFIEKILSRSDFDPTSLFQFSIFMSKGLLQVIEDVEANFGPEGQKICNQALIKVGYDIGKQTFGDLEIPLDISNIELISFVATIINTVFWSSVEDPHIINDKKCDFDILWCPLEDIYRAFDCRIQRYLVQGILNYIKELRNDLDYNLEFLSTIPSGSKTCKFEIIEKEEGVTDKWKNYSEILEKRALKRMKMKKTKSN